MIKKENLDLWLVQIYGRPPLEAEEFQSLSAVLRGESDRLFSRGGEHALGPFLLGACLPGLMVAAYEDDEGGRRLHEALESRGVACWFVAADVDEAKVELLNAQVWLGTVKVLIAPASLLTEPSFSGPLVTAAGSGFNLVLAHDSLCPTSAGTLAGALGAVFTADTGARTACVASATRSPAADVFTVRSTIGLGPQDSALSEAERDELLKPISRAKAPPMPSGAYELDEGIDLDTMPLPEQPTSETIRAPQAAMAVLNDPASALDDPGFDLDAPSSSAAPSEGTGLEGSGSTAADGLDDLFGLDLAAAPSSPESDEMGVDLDSLLGPGDATPPRGSQPAASSAEADPEALGLEALASWDDPVVESAPPAAPATPELFVQRKPPPKAPPPRVVADGPDPLEEFKSKKQDDDLRKQKEDAIATELDDLLGIGLGSDAGQEPDDAALAELQDFLATPASPHASQDNPSDGADLSDLLGGDPDTGAQTTDEFTGPSLDDLLGADPTSPAQPQADFSSFLDDELIAPVMEPTDDSDMDAPTINNMGGGRAKPADDDGFDRELEAALRGFDAPSLDPEPKKSKAPAAAPSDDDNFMLDAGMLMDLDSPAAAPKPAVALPPDEGGSFDDLFDLPMESLGSGELDVPAPADDAWGVTSSGSDLQAPSASTGMEDLLDLPLTAAEGSGWDPGAQTQAPLDAFDLDTLESLDPAPQDLALSPTPGTDVASELGMDEIPLLADDFPALDLEAEDPALAAGKMQPPQLPDDEDYTVMNSVADLLAEMEGPVESEPSPMDELLAISEGESTDQPTAEELATLESAQSLLDELPSSPLDASPLDEAQPPMEGLDFDLFEPEPAQAAAEPQEPVLEGLESLDGFADLLDSPLAQVDEVLDEPAAPVVAAPGPVDDALDELLALDDVAPEPEPTSSPPPAVIAAAVAAGAGAAVLAATRAGPPPVTVAPPSKTPPPVSVTPAAQPPRAGAPVQPGPPPPLRVPVESAPAPQPVVVAPAVAPPPPAPPAPPVVATAPPTPPAVLPVEPPIPAAPPAPVVPAPTAETVTPGAAGAMPPWGVMPPWAYPPGMSPYPAGAVPPGMPPWAWFYPPGTPGFPGGAPGFPGGAPPPHPTAPQPQVSAPAPVTHFRPSGQHGRAPLPPVAAGPVVEAALWRRETAGILEGLSQLATHVPTQVGGLRPPAAPVPRPRVDRVPLPVHKPLPERPTQPAALPQRPSAVAVPPTSPPQPANPAAQEALDALGRTESPAVDPRNDAELVDRLNRTLRPTPSIQDQSLARARDMLSAQTSSEATSSHPESAPGGTRPTRDPLMVQLGLELDEELDRVLDSTRSDVTVDPLLTDEGSRAPSARYVGAVQGADSTRPAPAAPDAAQSSTSVAGYGSAALDALLDGSSEEDLTHRPAASTDRLASPPRSAQEREAPQPVKSRRSPDVVASDLDVKPEPALSNPVSQALRGLLDGYPDDMVLRSSPDSTAKPVPPAEPRPVAPVPPPVQQTTATSVPPPTEPAVVAPPVVSPDSPVKLSPPPPVPTEALPATTAPADTGPRVAPGEVPVSRPAPEVRELVDLPPEGYGYFYGQEDTFEARLAYLRRIWDDPDSNVDRLTAVLPLVEQASPGDPRAPFAVGVLHFLSERRVQGLTALNRALDLMTAAKDSEGLSITLTLLHDAFPDDSGISERLVESLIARSQGSRAAHILLGLGEAALGRDQARKALTALDQAAKLDPGHRQIMLAQARACHVLGDENRALDVVNRGMDSAPGDALLGFHKAQILGRLGRAKAAETCMEKALQAAAGDPALLQSFRTELSVARDERNLRRVQDLIDALGAQGVRPGTSSTVTPLFGRVEAACATPQRPTADAAESFLPSGIPGHSDGDGTGRPGLTPITGAPAGLGPTPSRASPPPARFSGPPSSAPGSAVPGAGMAGAPADSEIDLFSRVRRRVPRVAADVRALQELEAEVRSRRDRNVVEDPQVVELLRKFQQVGDKLNAAAPDEAGHVYQRGMNYLTWFRDPLYAAVWRDDFERRLQQGGRPPTR